MADPKVEPPKPDGAGKPHGAPQDEAAVREVIEHTDSGSGRSQKEHWPPDPQGESH
jgi:hypothetical protein